MQGQEAKPSWLRGELSGCANDALWAVAALRRSCLSAAEAVLDVLIAWRVRRAEGRAQRARAEAERLFAEELARTAIDRSQQCRACGAKEGDIRYDPVIKFVIHTCRVCTASWAEPPIIAAKDWDFTGRDVEDIQRRKADVEKLFDAPLSKRREEKAEK